MTTDAIRQALVDRLAGEGSTVFQEVGLAEGAAVADVVAVHTRLVGYEIKGEADSARRLRSQARHYSALFDDVYLVAAERVAVATIAAVPAWWGVIVPGISPASLGVIRPCGTGPGPEPSMLAQVFWLDEAITLLESRGAARGVRGRPRRVVQARLMEAMTVDELRAAVRAVLLARPPTWGRRVDPALRAEDRA